MYRITLFLPNRIAAGAATVWFFFCNEAPISDRLYCSLAREYWLRDRRDQARRIHADLEGFQQWRAANRGIASIPSSTRLSHSRLPPPPLLALASAVGCWLVMVSATSRVSLAGFMSFRLLNLSALT